VVSGVDGKKLLTGETLRGITSFDTFTLSARAAGAQRYNRAIEKASVLLIFYPWENEYSLRIV